MTITEYSPLGLVFFSILWGWLYAIGVYLTKKLPETVKMNLSKFKWFMSITIIYLFLLCLSTYLGRFVSVSNEIQHNLLIVVILIPLHLFAIFCILYGIYYNAKLLKTIELQRLVIFSDFAGEFCLFLLFPIGIWVIQPKINSYSDTP